MPPPPGWHPFAVTVFLPYKSPVIAVTPRDREQTRARCPRPPGWHPPPQRPYFYKACCLVRSGCTLLMALPAGSSGGVTVSDVGYAMAGEAALPAMLNRQPPRWLKVQGCPLQCELCRAIRCTHCRLSSKPCKNKVYAEGNATRAGGGVEPWSVPYPEGSMQ